MTASLGLRIDVAASSLLDLQNEVGPSPTASVSSIHGFSVTKGMPSRWDETPRPDIRPHIIADDMETTPTPTPRAIHAMNALGKVDCAILIIVIGALGFLAGYYTYEAI